MEALADFLYLHQSLEIICMAITLITAFIWALIKKDTPLKKGLIITSGAFLLLTAVFFFIGQRSPIKQYVNQVENVANNFSVIKVTQNSDAYKVYFKNHDGEKKTLNIRKKYAHLTYHESHGYLSIAIHANAESSKPIDINIDRLPKQKINKNAKNIYPLAVKSKKKDLRQLSKVVLQKKKYYLNLTNGKKIVKKERKVYIQYYMNAKREHATYDVKKHVITIYTNLEGNKQILFAKN
ncbi:hypothetical protein LOC08_09365 [Lactobacillus delbrueckii subsp. lactis]|uniref:hypothetical protein n=1 Tax=Lactobacillus delbrueckii TaxID=1584 RepID=UPI0004AC3F38|nr:hypothetical protein [Lactobacillus delbrueckii]MCD5494010.1 hypothetical protein [Lactobacillus delbrueckii subsp. lactis]MCD5507403.1 hypothetical protein [Lactobacillus delbrueckii subsp. lactis]MCD5520647.1 hypothetical protein [Lactobacillus delbrueckii subsp. lactis]MCD5524487.1 hypothetical protein [Lactobacillus delbrueckii subsp. lactis]MCD5526379.1 hypothetical protein [Lactobacillus delbrueckii subsp. lactis]